MQASSTNVSTSMSSAMLLLDKSEYTEVLLSLLRGNTYASKIANDLRKAQPTISVQLKDLEKKKIVKRLARGNAQEYEVSWNELYKMIGSIINPRMFRKDGRLTKMLHREGATSEFLEAAKWVGTSLPEFLKRFITQYAVHLKKVDAAEDGKNEKRKKKNPNFEEIILSFFVAICFVRLNELNRLVTANLSEEGKIIVADAQDIVENTHRVALLAIRSPGVLFVPSPPSHRTSSSVNRKQSSLR